MNELDRLLELAGADVVNEITLVPPLKTSGIDQYDPKSGQEVFNVDGYPVYMVSIGNQDIYTAMDGDNVVSTSVFNKVNMPQYGEVYIAMRGYTEPKYRGKGISMKMTVDIKNTSKKVLFWDV